MKVIDGQGQTKGLQTLAKGIIVAFYGTEVPSGWALCDGTLGTPSIVGRVLVGASAVGTGTAGGTVDADTGLVHSGFALTAHSAHAVTQPANHIAHTVTQASPHSNHIATQPAVHATHATAGAHTHNAHTVTATGSLPVAMVKLTGPATHASDGGHAHDNPHDTGHTAFAVDAHSAHTGMTIDTHSFHAGFAVDAHSAHSITAQADTHLYKVHRLAMIYRL